MALTIREISPVVQQAIETLKLRWDIGSASKVLTKAVVEFNLLDREHKLLEQQHKLLKEKCYGLLDILTERKEADKKINVILDAQDVFFIE